MSFLHRFLLAFLAWVIVLALLIGVIAVLLRTSAFRQHWHIYAISVEPEVTPLWLTLLLFALLALPPLLYTLIREVLRWGR